MELVSRQIQERNGREEKRLLASSSAERRRLWLKVIGISSSFVFLVKDLERQLEEDKVLTIEKKSCAIIVRILSKNRRERKEEKRIRILFVMRNFTFIFRRLVSSRVQCALLSNCFALYCAILCYAMLCYAMLCYAMLYCAMLWYAMLRYNRLDSHFRSFPSFAVLCAYALLLLVQIKRWRCRRAVCRIVDLLTCCRSYIPPKVQHTASSTLSPHLTRFTMPCHLSATAVPTLLSVIVSAKTRNSTGIRSFFIPLSYCLSTKHVLSPFLLPLAISLTRLSRLFLSCHFFVF
jgi:hypothetical protein